MVMKSRAIGAECMHCVVLREWNPRVVFRFSIKVLWSILVDVRDV
jgi:hypothetical protein